MMNWPIVLIMRAVGGSQWGRHKFILSSVHVVKTFVWIFTGTQTPPIISPSTGGKAQALTNYHPLQRTDLFFFLFFLRPCRTISFLTWALSDTGPQSMLTGPSVKDNLSILLFVFNLINPRLKAPQWLHLLQWK